MYLAVADALARAECDDAFRAVVLTGSADSYRSGNDIGAFMETSTQNR